MAKVTLTKGYETEIDDTDFGVVSRHRWHVVLPGGTPYAARREYPSGKYIYLHRDLTGAAPHKQVDHANMNTLDNRRGNLRVCDKSRNGANRKRLSHSTQPFKGIFLDTRCNKWVARIARDKKKIPLGRFASAEDAARAYDAAAKKYYGEFARVNFPDAQL